jgi:hypothetical protein
MEEPNIANSRSFLREKGPEEIPLVFAEMSGAKNSVGAYSFDRILIDHLTKS